MEKKKREEECISLAVSELRKQHGESKRIGELIAGEEIQREERERPDFLRIYKPSQKGNQKIIVGIEHFCVDHSSIKLNKDRVGSSDIMSDGAFDVLKKKWQPSIEKGNWPEGAIVAMGNHFAKIAKDISYLSYSNYIMSFSYSLEKHIRSIKDYRSLISKYANHYKKKLVFLIEIHSNFYGTTFHNKREVYQPLPFFEEIVNILERSDLRYVDYLVFCFVGVSYHRMQKVVAVSAKNIRQQLKKQHIPVYLYAGEDKYLQINIGRISNAVSSHTVEDGTIHYSIEADMIPIIPMEAVVAIINAYLEIKTAEHDNCPFAASTLVRRFYNMYDEYLSEYPNLSVERVLNLLPYISHMNEKQIVEKDRIFLQQIGMEA